MVSAAGISELGNCEALLDVPELLPGEDHALGIGLFVGLVPKGCWFTSVRSGSLADWAPDLDSLTGADVTPREPPTPDQRASRTGHSAA